MKLPSKTIPYNQSIIAQFPKVLSRLDMGKLQIRNKVKAIKSNDELDAIFEEFGERKFSG